MKRVCVCVCVCVWGGVCCWQRVGVCCWQRVGACLLASLTRAHVRAPAQAARQRCAPESPWPGGAGGAPVATFRDLVRGAGGVRGRVCDVHGRCVRERILAFVRAATRARAGHFDMHIRIRRNARSWPGMHLVFGVLGYAYRHARAGWTAADLEALVREDAAICISHQGTPCDIYISECAQVREGALGALRRDAGAHVVRAADLRAALGVVTTARGVTLLARGVAALSTV